MVIKFLANTAAAYTIRMAETAKTHQLGGTGALGPGPLGFGVDAIYKSIYNCDRQMNKKPFEKFGDGFCLTAAYNIIVCPGNFKFKYFLLPLLLGGVAYTADFIRFRYYMHKQSCLNEYLESKGLLPLR